MDKQGKINSLVTRGGGTILKVCGPGLKKLMSGGGGLRHIFFFSDFKFFRHLYLIQVGGSPPTCPTSVVTSKKKKKGTQKVGGPGPHSWKSGWATSPHGPHGSVLVTLFTGKKHTCILKISGCKRDKISSRWLLQSANQRLRKLSEL